jgi:two-component system aerobic respiration control sensor histidine kinase ArcB
MDEIISKPVKKSRIIEVFNSLFCEQPSVPHQPAPEPKKDLLNAFLDLELLQMLVDTIGHEMVRTSVNVFQEKMPEYLEILQLSLSADEKDEVCSQAHKIKGAAGSVGLARVQKIANEIQQGDHPAWWQNVHDWVEQLNQAASQDMQKLINWLSLQDIDD